MNLNYWMGNLLFRLNIENLKDKKSLKNKNDKLLKFIVHKSGEKINKIVKKSKLDNFHFYNIEELSKSENNLIFSNFKGSNNNGFLQFIKNKEIESAFLFFDVRQKIETRMKFQEQRLDRR